jgi:hypothetical protein
MTPITFTIESVHGLKQTLTLDTFTVGPQPKSPTKPDDKPLSDPQASTAEQK